MGRGWCRKHYTRWNRYGDPFFVTAPPIPVRLAICTIDGCLRSQKSHGWCQTHYRRWQRHGDVTHLEHIRHAGSAEQRWWAKVDPNGPNGCWLWQGHLDLNGYGGFAVESRIVRAHRWGFEQFIRPVPIGLELDHLCHNPRCVRFDHLEPVSHAENVRRGWEWKHS